jgi:hypothetical protein
MTSRDRAAQAVIDGLATHEEAWSKWGSHKLTQARERGSGRLSEGPGGALPLELRAELRRLLAAILVADVRAYPTMPQEVDEPQAESPRESNRRPRPK